MFVYIFSIVLTLPLLKVALKCKNKWCRILPMIPSVLLLSFRGLSVGTDTFHYADLFESAQGVDSYIVFLLSRRLEYGFGTLLYFAAKTGLSVNFAFFLFAAFTVCPIFGAVFLLRDKLSPYLMTLLYLLMFYQYSFNIVRQSIAMSFIVLTIALLLSEHKKLAVFCSFIPMLFHNVAILIIPILLLYVINGKQKSRLLIITLLLLLICYYYGKDYILSSAEYYSDVYLHGDKVRAQLSYLIEMGFNLVIVFMAWLKLKNKETRYGLFITLLVFLLILSSTYFSYAFRIANCYDVLAIIFVPISMKILKNKSYKVSYLVFAVFYWWFVFVYNNSGGTYPYVFG